MRRSFYFAEYEARINSGEEVELTDQYGNPVEFVRKLKGNLYDRFLCIHTDSKGYQNPVVVDTFGSTDGNSQWLFMDVRVFGKLKIEHQGEDHDVLSVRITDDGRVEYAISGEKPQVIEWLESDVGVETGAKVAPATINFDGDEGAEE
jgi:cytochrome oxidase Cu insertion factor (SCO1/SenC/PrrC family)